ncbi:MAG: PAS domain S-box protein [Flavobacterium sp.]|uniref:PAS domain S-box protein n=1 Tax=Flavobacterium sp. TaxID=239 RepID=UPI003265A871
MVKKIKGSLELTLLVVVMSLFIIGVGVYGVLEVKRLNKSSKELYVDRMLPMDQLGDIRFYASSIIATVHQVDNKQITYREALQNVTQDQESIKTKWKNYLVTYLTSKEKQLAARMGIKIDQSNITIDNLKKGLQKEDANLLSSILKNELHSNLNSVIREASKLLRLQVEIGNEINKKNAEVYSSYTQKFIWILIIAFGFAVPFSYYLIKKNSSRETQLDLFIEHSPASLAMFDNEMRYVMTSRRWIADYNLFGQDIIGKTQYEVFPEIGQDWKDIYQRCLQGVIEKKEEDSILRADGSVEWLQWEVHPWYKSTDEIGGIIIFTEVITERKKATELFQKQFENSPDFIVYVNRFHKIEAINRGVTMSAEELIGQDCIEVLPKESRDRVKKSLLRCFETGLQQEIENPLALGKWARSRLVPIFRNLEVTHVLVFITDITEQKFAEQQLVHREEHYRALTENISDAILLLDEEGRIIYQSPSAHRISGYSFEDAKDKHITQFLTSEESDRGQIFLKEVFESPNVPIQNQFRFIHKNGHDIWLEGTVLNLLKNESVKAIIINYRDITKRKELEAQQALTVSIVKSSDDAIISNTLDGIITSWNKGAEKLLGYSAEETIGKNVTFLIPDYLTSEEKEISNQVTNGHPVDHFETVRQKKNGEIIHVSLKISSISDVSGNVVGASKIMRDITESKTFENELIRYNSELKKTNEELDRFVYSTSHDLRAPLKSMIGLINITAKDVKNKSQDNAEYNTILERLTMLNKSASKLDHFIEDILNFSRNARMEPESNEIAFEELVGEVTANLKYSDEKNIDFKVIINSKEKFVTDYKRLRVILNNIISNAYKYSDADKENSFINVIFTCDKNKATIIIKDNGIGIAQSDTEKVFDMFYRTTSLSTGSGLGLYIVKETVEKLNGKFSVESELGLGSAFCIEIPNQ